MTRPISRLNLKQENIWNGRHFVYIFEVAVCLETCDMGMNTLDLTLHLSDTPHQTVCTHTQHTTNSSSASPTPLTTHHILDITSLTERDWRQLLLPVPGQYAWCKWCKGHIYILGPLSATVPRWHGGRHSPVVGRRGEVGIHKCCLKGNSRECPPGRNASCCPSRA